MSNLGYSSVKIFHKGGLYFKDLEQDLLNAKNSIDFETYIFSEDILGKKIADILVQAVADGIQVRLLIDAVGSHWLSKDFRYALWQAGIDLRIYNRSLFRFNHRDHRKTVVIDKKIGWVGSFNVSNNHLYWRDTGVRFTGNVVKQLQTAFDWTWRRTHVRNLPRLVVDRFRHRKRRINKTPIRLNCNRRSRKVLYQDLLQRILNSKNRVWITTAYFVPEGCLTHTLRIAALSGVDVKILVPKYPDWFFMRWISSALYYALLKAGVKIHEYLPHVLHAKSIIIDDWVMMGSSNLNHRSLFHDLEIDVVVTQPAGVQNFKSQFLADLKKSQIVSLELWKQRGVLERAFGALLVYVKYWL